MSLENHFDVLIVGAGPAGSTAASILAKKKINVAVIEKSLFPRFTIGESLLPQCMVDLETAGFTENLEKHDFQIKNGANFFHKDVKTHFNFSEKFSEGPSTTYQVQRSKFDKILADTAQQNGAHYFFEHDVKSLSFKNDQVQLDTYDQGNNTEMNFSGKFILDASGFGRVLPKFLDLNLPSESPNRQSIFCHLKDNLSDTEFEREKIIIAVHDENPQVWFWLIGFSDGTSSLGVVCEDKFIDQLDGSPQEKLQELVSGSKQLHELLKKAEYNNESKVITSYSSKVKSLYGHKYALLGNAGEFLDPVFSSGVTIALRSATLAAPLVAKQINGESVDWENDFSVPLYKGINTFKAYVSSWYTGELQKIILTPKPDSKVKRMVCSVLAGYSWDETNPLVLKPKRRLTAIADTLAL